MSTPPKTRRQAPQEALIPATPRERERNRPPENVWQALRRLLLCNKQQLAARLGVTDRTLREWERATEEGGSAGANANRRAAELLQSVLRAAHCDQHAQWLIAWENIHKIGGKR